MTGKPDTTRPDALTLADRASCRTEAAMSTPASAAQIAREEAALSGLLSAKQPGQRAMIARPGICGNSVILVGSSRGSYERAMSTMDGDYRARAEDYVRRFNAHRPGRTEAAELLDQAEPAVAPPPAAVEYPDSVWMLT